MSYTLWVETNDDAIAVVCVVLGETQEEARENIDKIYELRDLVIDHKFSEAHVQFPCPFFVFQHTECETINQAEPLLAWLGDPSSSYNGCAWMLIDQLDAKALAKEVDADKDLTFPCVTADLASTDNWFYFDFLPKHFDRSVESRIIDFNALDDTAKEMGLLYDEED